MTIRINLDGPRHVGVDYPGVWAADPGRGGACGPNPYENGNPVHGTVDDPLFQGVMWGNPMTCAIGGGSLPSGLYRVRLLFGEVYFGAGCPGGGGNGSRVFDIELEGTRVMRDLDVHARTGGCICSTTGPNGRPFVRTYNVTITDGTLDVSMMASANEGNLSAIEVVSTF